MEIMNENCGIFGSEVYSERDAFQWRIYGGSGGVGQDPPPPLMGQHPISTDPTSPDFVHHKCKISYLKFL